MNSLLEGLSRYHPEYNLNDVNDRNLNFLRKMMQQHYLAKKRGGYGNVRHNDAMIAIQNCGYIRYID